MGLTPAFWYIMAAVYAFGGLLTVSLMVRDARQRAEPWPWFAYLLGFLLWWPLMAMAVVRHRLDAGRWFR